MMDNDDISHTIIAKSDQLNASDLLGGPITVTVEAVSVSQGDQPVSIQIGQGRQPFKPCLTVRRILANLWGPKSSLWIGRSMTLFCDETVRWAGEEAGGIRVSHLSHIDGIKEVTTRASKRSVTKSIIEPLVISLPAYSDADITNNSASWYETFKSGKSTPDKLIAAMKKKVTLTPVQEQTIRALATPAD